MSSTGASDTMAVAGDCQPLCQCCYYCAAQDGVSGGWYSPNGKVTELGRQLGYEEDIEAYACEMHNHIANADEYRVPHSRAPAPPQVEQQDIETRPLIDVDGPHVETVPSDYSGETETQQYRLEQEAQKAKERFEQTEKEASEKAREKGNKAKKGIKKAADDLDENKDNPVYIGNAALIAGVAGLFGFTAYRQQQAGGIDWKFAGAWAGALGLLATGDYFVTNWLFKNKYPRK